MAMNTEERREKERSRSTVSVIYYLTRYGQLQHPHFLEVVHLSSSTGLFLRDVIKRLDLLRGEGISRLYSWSSKRQYKNGYVWQDLSDDDLIHPSQGQDYILKGSELQLLDSSSSFRSCETLPETNNSSTDSNSFVAVKRNEHSSNSLEDLCRDVAYNAKISSQSGINASTQTDERRRRWTNNEEGFSNLGLGRTKSLRSVDCDGFAMNLRDQTAGKSNRWNPSTILMHLIKCNVQN